MKSANTAPVLDRLVGPLGECLTPESARRLLALKADRKLQARVDYLAGRCNEGLLTAEERAEYGNYVAYGTFVALLKSILLAKDGSTDNRSRRAASTFQLSLEARDFELLDHFQATTAERLKIQER